ncbi:hypothetical protein HRI_003208700 [Hibiscus trionum]|uniref:Uncharacterized protein n=1 Tax=Hibiscus trionum TaxID=183268 RepID=A0A9W7IG07_HIBTR|nr:hypothetical protein HRI_003208700 [Hibiscus trionum]
MLLPKMPPPVVSRRVDLWRRRAKVVHGNGEHLKPTPHSNNKEAQTLKCVDDNKEKEKSGFRGADEPPICPSSPSFKFYINPSVKDNKNDGGKESLGKTAANLESQTPLDLVPTEESTTKMKCEHKGMRMWRVIPNGKTMKRIIHTKPCGHNVCYGAH